MSLLRAVVRMCAVAALRDKTWAQGRVYDSDMTPFADAVFGQAAAPYTVVYTDTDDRTMVTGAELYNGDQRQLSLVFEMGIASSTKNGAGGLTIQFSATDEGMEFAVDVLESQIIAALFGDPTSAWGNLLRRIVYRVKRMPSRRGGQAQKGIRFAARRTVLVCSTIDDIPPGVLIGDNHPVRQFIAMAAAADPALGIGETAALVAKLLETSAAPTWRQAQAYMGMSTEAVEALNADVPLPWPGVEIPPLDFSDTDEFVPPLTVIATPMSLSPFQALTASPLTTGSPVLPLVG